MPQDKPKVSLNLDSLERENRAEPFSVVIGGKRYVLLDVQDTDYRALLGGLRAAQTGRPEVLMALIVPAKDIEAFDANSLPTYKLQALIAAYMKHYGVDLGEAPASSPS